MKLTIKSCLVILIWSATISACAQVPGENLTPTATSEARAAITTPARTTSPQPAATASAQPPLPRGEVIIRDHSQARDAAVAHVAQVYDLEQPESWQAEELPLGDLVGSTAFRYTSGAWVVQVSAPVVALENVIYSVVVDQLQAGVHWEGLVNAFGDMAEGEVAPLAAITSPQAARDMALAYISRNYGKVVPMDWNSQDVPQTAVGSTRYRYTSGTWTVNVVEPASAPLASEYQVAVQNSQDGFGWQGMVSAQGVVSERPAE